MAAHPSTPPPRTAQGCRLSSRLVTPKLLLDTAHGPCLPRPWQARLQVGSAVLCFQVDVGRRPTYVTLGLGHTQLLRFLFCGMISGFLLVLGAGGGRLPASSFPALP